MPMQIANLIRQLPLTLQCGDGQTRVTDLTDDSRLVTPPIGQGGMLFVARTGADHDGARYIPAAVDKGAVAVVSTEPAPADLPAHVAWLRADAVDQALAGRIADRLFNFPSQKLKLIGVTGTNGKTTTTCLIQYLLNKSGIRAGLLGTIFTDDGHARRPANLTTPGRIELTRLFAAMVEHGCEAAVMEVSSHALEQGRVDALDFHVAVFTNLTRDHLDYHRTMDLYADAKAGLFGSLRKDAWAVVNGDDPYHQRMLRDCRARQLICTVEHITELHEQPIAAHDSESVQTTAAHTRFCEARIESLAADASHVHLNGIWGSIFVRLPLVGQHNVHNTLQAVAAASIIVDFSRTELHRLLEHCPPVPGRLEPVSIETPDPKSDRTHENSSESTTTSSAGLPVVLVDYAHTPDALINVCAALKPLVRGRLIVLFGCGGDRDRTKRPLMAAAACEYGDLVILTSDNPRTEDPQRILDDVLAGVPAAMRDDAARFIVEIDRSRAIEKAIQLAAPADTVLLAGKGHEDYQIIADPQSPGQTKKIHFDDREQAQKALQAIN